MVGGYERTELIIMPGGHSGVIAPLSMMKDLPMKSYQRIRSERSP